MRVAGAEAMGPDFSGGDPDFEFAFDSSNFSDRVLRIEIVEGERGRKGDGDGGCHSIAEWTSRKRRREEIGSDNASECTECDVELALGYNQLEAVDYAGADTEVTDMMEEPLLGVEAARSSDPSWTADRSASLRVRTIYISSPILAAKSPFFYKLFSNSIMDSDLQQATLRIFASEEAALMELLRYMYSGRLSSTSVSALLDVLMSADKYKVASCVRHCGQLLQNVPMTPESALLYLELPYSVSLASEVQPLIDTAKEYLANRYKDIAKCQDEVMKLPLAGLEAILCNDGLQVTSEDALYDFVLKWARTWYPKLEDRREILGTRLCRLIRFPHMTSRKLKKVLTCNDLDHDIASTLVLEGLFFKAEAPHRQRALCLVDSFNRRFSARAYKYRPLKIVEFDAPQQQCIVYLDLKRDECSSLFPSSRIYSQAFHFGGQGFFLSAHCNMDQQNLFHCFGFFLGMQDKGSASLTLDYEFAARTTDTKEFVSKYRGCYAFTGGKAVGYRNIFGIPWKTFMSDDSLYFVNDMLHLRAELTVKQPQSKVQKLV